MADDDGNDNVRDAAADIRPQPPEGFGRGGEGRGGGFEDGDVEHNLNDGNTDDDNNNNNNEHEIHRQNQLRIRRLAERRRNAANLHRVATKHRFRQYAVFSLGSAASLVYYAFFTRQQFYPAVVYLSSSKLAYVMLGNAWVCLTVLIFRLVTYVFLNGGLREVEREAVGDGLRWGLMETCLALTIFREEVTIHMAAMFLALALAKCLHWSVELRGGHIQQTDAVAAFQPQPNDDGEQERDDEDGVGVDDNEDGGGGNGNDAAAAPRGQVRARREKKKNHVGFFLLSVLLLVADFFAVVHCATQCAENGPSVHILFGNEAAILVVSAISTLCTYALHVIDHVVYVRRGKTFHSRGTVAFAMDVAFEGCKFLFYLVFFTIVFTYYGMPINIFRDLWVSYTSLKRKLSSFARYRRLTSNMNERFDDASQKELEDCGHVCIICRDHMDGGKKLPCGHVFHFYCLREWLQQQQSCPTCRGDIPAERKRDGANAAERRQEEQVQPPEGAGTHGGAGVANAAGAGGEQRATTVSVSPEAVGSTLLGTPASAEASASLVLDTKQGEEGTDPFPCLYRVIGDDGAPVYQLKDKDEDASSSSSSSLSTLVQIRVVPHGKLILCTEMRWIRCSIPLTAEETTDGAEGWDVVDKNVKNSDTAVSSGRMMVKTPDGWVVESDLTRIPVPLSELIAPSSSAPAD